MESTDINMDVLYNEIVAELRDAELRVAELRGQLKLIQRIINDAQAVRTEGEDTQA